MYNYNRGTWFPNLFWQIQTKVFIHLQLIQHEGLLNKYLQHKRQNNFNTNYINFYIAFNAVQKSFFKTRIND